MAASAMRTEHVAETPRGWRVRTIVPGPKSEHEVRIAFPPGKRKKGSGRVVEILHPASEKNPKCAVSEKAKKNPAELLIFGNPGGIGNHKPGCACAFCKRAAQLQNNPKRAGSVVFEYQGRKFRGKTEAEAKKRALKWFNVRGGRAARKTHTRIDRGLLNPKRFSGWSFFTKQEKNFLKKLHAAAPKNEETVRAYKETLKKIDETNAKYRNPKRATPRRRRADRLRNPSETEEAVRLFESFHGKDPKDIVEKHVSAAMRLDYATLGDLVKLRIKSPLGELYELDFEGEGVKLASSPDGKQLYCIGGRQNIEKCLDADSLQKDFIDLGHCVRVEYLARKIHANYEPVVYYHKMGEKTGDQPTLIYDKLRKQIFFTGGAYFIDKDKGVSPGIEN